MNWIPLLCMRSAGQRSHGASSLLSARSCRFDCCIDKHFRDFWCRYPSSSIPLILASRLCSCLKITLPREEIWHMVLPSAPSNSRSTALQRVSGDFWKVLAAIAILATLLLRTDLAYSHSRSTTAEDPDSTAIRGRSRVLSGSAGDSEPAIVEDIAFPQTPHTVDLNCPAKRSSFSQSVQEGSKGLKDAPPVSTDACAAALHLPKLALLFLTVGSLPHDKLWSDWFSSAKGKTFTAPSSNFDSHKPSPACIPLCGSCSSLCILMHACARFMWYKHACTQAIIWQARVHCHGWAVMLHKTDGRFASTIWPFTGKLEPGCSMISAIM